MFRGAMSHDLSTQLFLKNYVRHIFRIAPYPHTAQLNGIRGEGEVHRGELVIHLIAVGHASVREVKFLCRASAVVGERSGMQQGKAPLVNVLAGEIRAGSIIERNLLIAAGQHQQVSRTGPDRGGDVGRQFAAFRRDAPPAIGTDLGGLRPRTRGRPDDEVVIRGEVQLAEQPLLLLGAVNGTTRS